MPSLEPLLMHKCVCVCVLSAEFNIFYLHVFIITFTMCRGVCTLHVFVLLCVMVNMQGQRTTCGNRFSHSTMVGLRGEAQVIGRGGKHACLLSRLPFWCLPLAVYYKHLFRASVSGVPRWWSVAIHSFQVPLSCRQPELPDPHLG